MSPALTSTGSTFGSIASTINSLTCCFCPNSISDDVDQQDSTARDDVDPSDPETQTQPTFARSDAPPPSGLPTSAAQSTCVTVPMTHETATIEAASTESTAGITTTRKADQKSGGRRHHTRQRPIITHGNSTDGRSELPTTGASGATNTVDAESQNPAALTDCHANQAETSTGVVITYGTSVPAESTNSSVKPKGAITRVAQSKRPRRRIVE